MIGRLNVHSNDDTSQLSLKHHVETKTVVKDLLNQSGGWKKSTVERICEKKHITF